MIRVLRYNYLGDLVRDTWRNGTSAINQNRHGVSTLVIRDAQGVIIGMVESEEVESWSNAEANDEADD
jgi:hypothetical protein